ncbi:hypothetical protein N3K66_002466 [Trichothecium roseum]|uniref:Uncharacterized protein n=1 Tax=Trichothecium roseum TaxID=47278 RepID=A0ACC0V9Q0_9HYPO|nr:hypothetical protein N3K66_002466 [Trichothecium roseum]
MSYHGYGGQPPYGQPPPPQGYGQYPPPSGPPPGQYPPQYPPGHQPPPPQGGYYQQPPPPQGGHYPPHGQYPPPGHAPGHSPQPPYGQPPPPQHYGQPPSGPPPQHYGQQPPPSPYGYPPGGPPPGQGGHPNYPPTPPSVGYGPPQTIQWDGAPDAQALRGAMKGLGTDEKALIRVLSNKDPLQIETIRNAFDRSFRRNLLGDLASETSGWFEKGLLQVARGPLNTDCYNLYEAMDGPGTKEAVLNDILLSRSNADLNAIKRQFQQLFKRPLEDMVKGDLSMKTERHFMLVLAANRAEDSAPVIPQQVDDDVMQLYKATEGRTGTDEILVCSILTSRNNDQLRAVAHAYKQKFRKDLDDVIRSEFSGHMKEALLFQLRHAVDKYMHAANLLEEAMAGMGTKDWLLVTRVVRYHWDPTMLANVKAAYQQRYRKSLGSRIKGETSGDYQRLMLGCIGEWS